LDDVEELLKRKASVLIGICTEDFSMLHDLVSVLNAEGVRYLITGPGEVVSAHLDCLVMDKGTECPILPSGAGSTVPMDPDPVVTTDRALASCWGLDRPLVLTIGIDPGSRPGVAYILDGRLVAVHRASSARNLLGNVLKRERSFRARRTIVKVGNGDPSSRDLIISSLRVANLLTIIVDERGTSRSKRHRDEMAAIHIARVECSPVQ
jgi:hypothetical protein